jgi:hydrogenase expression/formation protein HypD
VLPMFKLIPPALRFVAGSKRIAIDGFILPGHVSTVIGTKPYRFLADEFRLPCCVVGFEATDILDGILSLLEQLRAGPRVDNRYRRSVRSEGNLRALELLRRVFKVCDAGWRGLGTLSGSGLAFRPGFRRFDARARFAIRPVRSLSIVNRSPLRACRCGDVMLGLIVPTGCRLFGRVCTPESPVGPCMVSSEGACAAYWKFER